MALPHDLEFDPGVHRPTHLLDRLVEGQALHWLVVQMRDDVACDDTGLGGRPLVDRRHHFDKTVLHSDLDTEATELVGSLRVP